VIGIWSSCENLGGVFANNVAATALSKGGWRAAFFVSGPLVGIWSVILLFVLPADSVKPAKQTKEKAKEKAMNEGVNEAPSALSIPGVAAAAAAYTLTKYAPSPPTPPLPQIFLCTHRSRTHTYMPPPNPRTLSI
jgi:sugar phosphate permease